MSPPERGHPEQPGVPRGAPGLGPDVNSTAGDGGGGGPARASGPPVPPEDSEDREDVSELDLLDAGAAEPGEGEGEGDGAETSLTGLTSLSEFAGLERERDEYLDALRRLQAEFDNYRKRVDRNRQEMVDSAASGLVKKLLPVLDAADLALAHGGGEDIKQVAGALFDILGKEGLERIDPNGQAFDPQHHDAVAHEPANDDNAPEQPEVSEVLRAGYSWRGRVLRPAMVKVRG